MAEALGIVSSGFAVASLALQLVSVSQNLYNFWKSFEDANSNVESIKTHLSTLRAISADVAEICEREPHIQCGDSVIKSLQTCKAKTEKLTYLISDIGSDRHAGRRGRTWVTLRATLKEKTIRKIESQLREDVMMLILALQPFFHRIQQNKIDSVNFNFNRHAVSFHNEQDLTIEKSSKNPRHLSEQKESANWRQKMGKLTLTQFKGQYLSFKLDSLTIVEKIVSLLGIRLSRRWYYFLKYYSFGLTYLSATHQLYLDVEQILLTNVKRRLRVTLPVSAFQLQTSIMPFSLTAYPIVPCQSQIFKFCLEGDIKMVRLWFRNSWTSPYVVNQHGENLLHTAAKYAHAELCNLLLDFGVDGAAYDDRLLTPLDHLARKVCLVLAYPSQVVDTIRALVERGRCQPLLPVTSNAIAFYTGPEEGFAWLFSSEYAGVDLEEHDSGDWTLLGDAAFNFGWWTQYDVKDPAVSWQCLYLLRAGANPHTMSCEGRLTPLDAFLRGCTANKVDHAGKWLQVLSECGINLHEYAQEEQRLHHPEHFLKAMWDEELWTWIPIKRRVVYKFGEIPDVLEIWLEDYDALSWFHSGRYDLEIFDACSLSESAVRWKKINARDYLLELSVGDAIPRIDQAQKNARLLALHSLISARLFQFLFTLAAYHLFRVLFINKQ